MRTHCYFFFIAFLVISQGVFAQNDTIMGVLLDLNDKVIKNYPVFLGRVSPVKVKTDKNGIFTFANASLQDTLFVGDKKGRNLMAIPVNGYPFVTIKSLKGNFNTVYHYDANEQLLQHMQHAQKVRMRQASIASKEDIAEMGCRDVLCVLQRINGVIVTGRTVRVRGISTTINNNEPLFILDGMPISQDSLSTIPIGDIEYISVMKEASIYGARGANGAIIINTRK